MSHSAHYFEEESMNMEAVRSSESVKPGRPASLLPAKPCHDKVCSPEESITPLAGRGTES